MSDIKSQIQTSFKFSGLSIRLEACKYLVDLLTPIIDDERQGWIDKILDEVQTLNLKSNVIDKETLSQALKECTNREAGNSNVNAINVISAFDTPRLTFNPERKKYLPDNISGRQEPQLLSPPDSKSKIFQDRYSMLHQRTARHDLFNPSHASAGKSKTFQLKAVEYLLGTTNRLDEVIVLGMITQLSHGTYHLEDPSGVVQLDLTETKFHTGLYTENCFVLAEGWYDDNVFHVLALGFPPAEESSTTRAYFGNINFFGGPSETSLKASTALSEIETNNPDAMFVFLSDVWLDNENVMNKLRRLFSGFNSMPPTAFVLFGNFLSCAGEPGYAKKLKEHFKILGDMIAEYPEIANESMFMLVPGPADPGSPNIFPRPPLPSHVIKDLLKNVQKLELLTNPARIQYCTQEIVVFREDIVTKLCRNSIYFPETGGIPNHFAKTITSQGHLTPLPLHTCPIYWDYDRSLSLYPLPDLVVTADKFEPFTAENLGCQIINPGTFSKHNFSFKTYIPNSRTVEDSQVPEDD